MEHPIAMYVSEIWTTKKSVNKNSYIQEDSLTKDIWPKKNQLTGL